MVDELFDVLIFFFGHVRVTFFKPIRSWLGANDFLTRQVWLMLLLSEFERMESLMIWVRVYLKREENEEVSQ